MPTACAAAGTSTALASRRVVVVVADSTSALAVKSPGGLITAVDNPSSCSVTAFASAGQYRLMVSSWPGRVSNRTGSLSTGAPGGMSTDVCPAKLTLRTESARTAPASSAAATVTAPINKGRAPNSFDSRRRSCAPPAESRTRWRSVRPLRSGTEPGDPGNACCGLAAQLAIQRCAPEVAGEAAPGAGPARTAAQDISHVTRTGPRLTVRTRA